MREEASSCSQRTQTVHTFTLSPSFSGRRPEPIAVEFVLCTLSGGCIHTYHSTVNRRPPHRLLFTSALHSFG